MSSEKDGEENPDPIPRMAQPDQPTVALKSLPKRPRSSAARRSLVLAIAFWLIMLSSWLLGDFPLHHDGLVFLIIFAAMGSWFFSLLFCLGAVVKKIWKFLSRRPSAPVWPAWVALALILFPLTFPYLRWLPTYFRTGDSYRHYSLMQKTNDDLHFFLYIIETNQRERGIRYPWCPMERRRDAFYDLKGLPPEVRAMPVVALSAEEIRFIMKRGLPPAYVGDPFGGARKLPLGYYAPGFREGTTPTSSTAYILWSCGPDGKYDLNAANIETAYNPAHPIPSAYLIARIYDPSNGATSAGDIVRYKTPSSH